MQSKLYGSCAHADQDSGKLHGQANRSIVYLIYNAQHAVAARSRRRIERLCECVPRLQCKEFCHENLCMSVGWLQNTTTHAICRCIAVYSCVNY